LNARVKFAAGYRGDGWQIVHFRRRLSGSTAKVEASVVELRLDSSRVFAASNPADRQAQEYGLGWWYDAVIHSLDRRTESANDRSQARRSGTECN
jgi:hypothetical protein